MEATFDNRLNEMYVSKIPVQHRNVFIFIILLSSLLILTFNIFPLKKEDSKETYLI